MDNYNLEEYEYPWELDDEELEGVWGVMGWVGDLLIPLDSTPEMF